MESQETAAAYLKCALADCGFEQDARQQCLLYTSQSRWAELLRLLNRQRCILLEDLHTAQRKVDAVDYVIRLTAQQKSL